MTEILHVLHRGYTKQPIHATRASPTGDQHTPHCLVSILSIRFNSSFSFSSSATLCLIISNSRFFFALHFREASLLLTLFACSSGLRTFPVIGLSGLLPSEVTDDAGVNGWNISWSGRLKNSSPYSSNKLTAFTQCTATTL